MRKGNLAFGSGFGLVIILASLFLPHSASAVSYTYDLAGRRTSMTDPTGTTTYQYDAAGRLTKITDPGGKLTSYTL